MIATVALIGSLGISGTYFESRTCSIFAGPCHFSGEVMTDGATAVIAVEFDKGSFDRVDLRGASFAVVISAARNFAFESERQSAIFVSGSTIQRAAVTDFVQSRSGIDIGTVKFIEETNIRLKKTETGIEVAVGEVFSAVTSERECLACSMQGTLWFDPLTREARAKVATVETQKLHLAALDQRWTRTDEAAAFVGSVSW